MSTNKYINPHAKKHIKTKSKDFVTAEEGESYAIIKSNKGDARFDVEIIRTGKVLIAKAAGRIIRGPGKQRLNIGDTVLIQEGDKSYIINKYSDDEVRKLTKLGELKFKNVDNDDDDDHIIFENDVVDNKINSLEIDDEFIMGI